MCRENFYETQSCLLLLSTCKYFCGRGEKVAFSFPVFSSFLSHRCLTARPPPPFGPPFGFMKMSVPPHP